MVTEHKLDTPKFVYFLIFSTIFCEKQRYFNSEFLSSKHYYRGNFGRKRSAKLAFLNEL